MALRLHNTLSLEVERLTPLRTDSVRMYTCGPTVYHYVHIGNFRTFMFQDILRRYLRYRGFNLIHVMNITDVDDKIIAAASAAGVTIGEYTKKYSDAFLEDMDTLRIQRPEIMPRATDHIEEMVELIGKLEERGLTYRKDGSIYFRIEAFENYGRLSHLDSSQEDFQGRIDSDEYDKENPRDFALWKARKTGEEYWDTTLGEGRPGWHIECSAMSMKYLGESFDIHCGGVDLIFPHHENELAQSEGGTGRPFVRHWVHGAHLIVGGEKMSKSKGNFYTLRDLLERGVSPVALRYLLLSVHYRRQLNFTFDGLEQAGASLQRVDDLLQKLRELPGGRQDAPGLAEAIERAGQGFQAGLDNDLNTSEALAALFELVREVNIRLEAGQVGDGDRDRTLALFAQANLVFDVFRVEDQELDDEAVTALIAERRQARRDRSFQRADGIREQLLKMGIILEDTKEGTRWKRAH